MDIITLALAKKMINSQKDAYESELWTIGSNGNWFLGEVDTGLPSKGDTPKKGIDYFTEEDKQELVQEVITALPKYNGETSDKS